MCCKAGKPLSLAYVCSVGTALADQGSTGAAGNMQMTSRCIWYSRSANCKQAGLTDHAMRAKYDTAKSVSESVARHRPLD